MQSNTEPSNDRNPDLFAELVQSIHQSHLLLNTSSTQSTSASPRTTYSGEAEECSGFLLQCSLLFEMQPQLFPSDRAKIAYIISLLSGRALQWAWSVWDAQGPITNLLTAFVAHFKEVFGQSPNKLSVNDQLFQLRQGQSSVNDYAFQFHTLAATSGWNKAALITAFRQGLNVNICQQMAIYDVVGLENFIQRAIRVSQHLTACNLEVTALSPPPASPSVPEPMQIDSYHLTHAEHQWRVINGLCLYCGAAGHLMSLCPVRLPHPARKPFLTQDPPGTSSH
uniref:DUF4939 domain-containing protein n=1 Tax=Cyprinus carpio carpio TaxID=630221 RepID=A0A9J7X318_CYPCA